MVAAAAIALYALAGAAPLHLVLTRGATLAAQPWGLITGHLVHSDLGHLLWDAAGLLLVGLVYEPLLRARAWLALGLGLLVIDVAFLAGMTEWARYCGLSGLINALVGAGLMVALRRRDPGAVVFGLLVLGKVLLESASGTALLTETSWPAVPMAHLAGITAGIVVGLIVVGLQQWHCTANSTLETADERR
jgi:rhomboid family GlyGly-CTERM serine protease